MDCRLPSFYTYGSTTRLCGPILGCHSQKCRFMVSMARWQPTVSIHLVPPLLGETTFDFHYRPTRLNQVKTQHLKKIIRVTNDRFCVAKHYSSRLGLEQVFYKYCLHNNSVMTSLLRLLYTFDAKI